MARTWMYLVLAALTVSACGSDSNPFDEEPAAETPDGGSGDDGSGDDGSGGDDDPLSPINGDLTRPPGTANPTPNTGIYRYEEMTADGNGFALRPVYSADGDTFDIENLAFDGANEYERDEDVPSLGPTGEQGPFYVYEGTDKVIDPVNGKEIDQFDYKAIYALSTSGATEAVIVRTGSYEDYGFGGYIYQRNDGQSVVIPTSGQARFDGDYSGLRDFQGAGGLQYAIGKIQVDIDFEDFDGNYAQDAIKGMIYDRRIYDTSGTDLTQSILDQLNDDAGGTAYTALPVIDLDVGPNTIDRNGEAMGELGSEKVVGGNVQDHLTGEYYAILAGNNPDEITGIVVIDGNYTIVEDDGTFGAAIGDVINVRETGVFTADR